MTTTMIHSLSRATSYLQSFCIRLDGLHVLRSHATGFFVRVKGAILLVTNWHVVSGLNPADPGKAGNPSPHYLKVTVLGRNSNLVELSVSLYDADMKPRWYEHPSGHVVDIALLELPEMLEEYFYFVDIHSVEDDAKIVEAVAKDVFILGYPFSKAELEAEFGAKTLYFLPVWKRGSIATEPAVPLRDRVVLIDSLSRAGMSGAPVLIAQDHMVMRAKNAQGNAFIKAVQRGDKSALTLFDQDSLEDAHVKRFKLLGVYSGTIGSTKMGEIALGKCWTTQTLAETVNQARPGYMPSHAPEPNAHYAALLQQVAGGQLVIRNAAGDETGRVQLNESGRPEFGGLGEGASTLKGGAVEELLPATSAGTHELRYVPRTHRIERILWA